MSKYSVVTLEEVESTNAYALEFINSLDDKTVICANKQTNGRGRYNRKWVGDDSSNVYMSIVLKPEKKDGYPFSNLTQYLSVVVSSILDTNFDIKSSIKWPNDILVNGAKISGILAESSVKSNKIEGIVLGLGLNVNLQEETLKIIDQKATSLYILKNKKFDTNDVIKCICEKFFKDYDKFIDIGFKFIKEDYVKRCDFLGKKIVIRENNKQYTALSIDDSGLLIAKDDLNVEHKIITGDILCQ